MINTWIYNLIEICFSLGLFINALLFLPQIVAILRKKSAQGVSLLTFAGFNFIQLMTILHAYIVKDYLLFIGFLLSFITCGFVTFLIIFYRYRHK